MNDAQTHDSSGPGAGPAVHVVNPTRKAPALLIVSSADADNDTTFGFALQWSIELDLGAGEERPEIMTRTRS